ncbi:hypothetical protein A5731_24715 [Mycolicibacterium conceptionense]|nr:hypothetical protein A5718_16110 [Mycolicibacterium conceptionense]OBE96781.1 hypothetical protein A5731_24715 [Mycolicibacterium conceptionense]OBF26290.1 hypothetical protein A5726_05925 [Mycolicibacterium conceptionense]OBF37646.1 hypothetical protein A5720_19540 [Mycolicibacterium conceptionense]OBH94266.1 hypothetical protein A5716_25750 [Mycolicibacterium conceptionense]
MAGVGAIALASMGALGAVMVQVPVSGATVGPLPAAGKGETVTKTTAPSELETSFAKPTVKVDLPDGYGN